MVTSALSQTKRSFRSAQNRLSCVAVLAKVTYIRCERRLAEPILDKSDLYALFDSVH